MSESSRAMVSLDLTAHVPREKYSGRGKLWLRGDSSPSKRRGRRDVSADIMSKSSQKAQSAHRQKSQTAYVGLECPPSSRSARTRRFHLAFVGPATANAEIHFK